MSTSVPSAAILAVQDQIFATTIRPFLALGYLPGPNRPFRATLPTAHHPPGASSRQILLARVLSRFWGAEVGVNPERWDVLGLL